jgi:hypothetical protein
MDEPEDGIARVADSESEANNHCLTSSDRLEMLCVKGRGHTL